MSDFWEHYLDIVNASINFVRLKVAPSHRFTAFAGSYSVVLDEEQLLLFENEIHWVGKI